MNPFDLKGRAALVTGGNGGMGLGMAKGLAQAGASVAIAGRDEKKNAEAIKELKALGVNAFPIKANLRDEKAARAAVNEAAEKPGRRRQLAQNTENTLTN